MQTGDRGLGGQGLGGRERHEALSEEHLDDLTVQEDGRSHAVEEGYFAQYHGSRCCQLREGGTLLMCIGRKSQKVAKTEGALMSCTFPLHHSLHSPQPTLSSPQPSISHLLSHKRERGNRAPTPTREISGNTPVPVEKRHDHPKPTTSCPILLDNPHLIRFPLPRRSRRLSLQRLLRLSPIVPAV